MKNNKEHIQPSYKPSLLGPIPDNWEIIKLCNTVYSDKPITYGIVKAGDYKDVGIYMIRSQDYSTGWCDIDQIMKVTKEIEEPYVRSRVKKDDILITLVGAGLGNTAVVPDWLDGANISRASGRISIDDQKANKNYVYHYLSSGVLNKVIGEILIGGAQPVLNLEALNDIDICSPPLPEQTAIANLLSTWDKAIQTTTALIAQKEQRKKWLKQQLLTGKKRLKGFGGEWKEYHLSDVFTERNETGYLDLPLLSVGASGIYRQSDSIKKDTSNEDKSKYRRICPGDIGYNTMRMWQGRSALSHFEGIVSPAYTIVTPKENADSLFFSYLFKTTNLINHFWRNSQGLVDDTLNCKWKDFSIVKTLLPPTKKEQTAIAAVFQAADKEIQLLKAKADALKEQKKGLMQVLLTGKIRLRV